jgi:hypothetical protein
MEMLVWYDLVHTTFQRWYPLLQVELADNFELWLALHTGGYGLHFGIGKEKECRRLT